MPAVVVYDLQRGPVAADAVDAVLDPQFADELADALGVANADRLPPAALMAEWAVRCAYTDGVSGWAPVVAVEDEAWDLADGAGPAPEPAEAAGAEACRRRRRRRGRSCRVPPPGSRAAGPGPRGAGRCVTGAGAPQHYKLHGVTTGDPSSSLFFHPCPNLILPASTPT